MKLTDDSPVLRTYVLLKKIKEMVVVTKLSARFMFPLSIDQMDSNS